MERFIVDLKKKVRNFEDALKFYKMDLKEEDVDHPGLRDLLGAALVKMYECVYESSRKLLLAYLKNNKDPQQTKKVTMINLFEVAAAHSLSSSEHL